MALQFNPPNLPNLGQSPAAAGITALGQGIANLPQMWMEYKLKRQQTALQAAKLQQEMAQMQAEQNLKQQTYTSQYGTGETLPFPEKTPSNPFEKLRAIGTEGVKALNESTHAAGSNPNLFAVRGMLKDGRSVAPNRQGEMIVSGGGKPPEVYDPKMGDIQPSVSPTAPAGEINAMTDLKNSIDQLNEAKQLFSPDYTGPIESRLSDFSKATGIDLPGFKTLYPDNLKFRIAMQSAINDYIKAITGAQMGELEAKRIMRAMPNSNQADEAFIPVLDEVVKLADKKLQNRLTILEESGYRNIGALREFMKTSTAINQPTYNAEQLKANGLIE